MREILKLKRLSCLVAVLALPFVALPTFTSVDVDAACVGPTNARELENTIRDNAPGLFDWSSSISITLCGDINGEVLAYSDFFKRYDISIDLNGHKIKKASGNAIVVGNNAYLTLTDSVGGGGVVGGFNADASRLTIAGGSYTQNPSAYVKDQKLKVYKPVGSTEFKVETKFTDTDVSVSPVIVVRVGGAKEITAKVEVEGSTTGFKFTSSDESIASVDASGGVTGVGAGETTITVTPTYDTTINKTVNVKVLPVLTSISANDVVVKKDGTVTITTPAVEDASLAEGVTFTYASENESVATVDENGQVTGLSAGKADITITATYKDELGEMTATTTITASVYDVKAGKKDDEEVAADTVRDILDEGLPEDMTTASDTTKEAFGGDFVQTGDALKTAMGAGSIITTQVNVEEATDADAMAKIDEVLAGEGVNVTEIAYFDVTVSMEGPDGRIGLLRKLNEKLTIALATYEEPAEGYTRKYYVVAYHEGDDFATILAEGTDYKIENGQIYIMSDRFSTFAVAYEDTPIEVEPEETPAEETMPTSPNTGFNTVAKTYKSAVNNNLVSFAFVAMISVMVGIVATVKAVRRK